MTLALELIVLLAAIAIGARASGVGMGLWGGVGLAVLVFGFGETPGSIPGEVLLIILTVIMAASAMEAAGGIDYLVQIAARIIRRSPRHVTIIAPVVAYAFTFLAGTGHVFYPLLPVNGLMILKNACVTLAARCISGITANEQRCRHFVENSIGIVTALVPVIGYEKSAAVAKEALATGGSVYELLLQKGWLTKEKLDDLLSPANMTDPRQLPA